MPELIAFLSHHWFLSVCLLAVGFAILTNEWLIRKFSAVKLAPSALVRLMNGDNARAFDVRSKQAFDAGHIAGSKWLNPENLSPEKFTLTEGQTVVLLCQDGMQSKQIASRMKQQGMHNIAILDGGLNNWTQQQLPLTKKGKA